MNHIPLRFTLALLFTSLAFAGMAQNALPIGQWRTHFSYRKGTYVTQSPTEIIYSTGRSILFVDKQEESTRRLTRADGLSQTVINIVRYHAPTETLIIVYDNSVIDLYRPDGSITTLTQIDNFNFSGGDNRINDIFIDETNVVYLAAGYGVSALNVEQGTFPFTTFMGTSANTVAVYDNAIWAGTDEGIYRAPTTGSNLNDFTNWTLLDTDEGFPADYRTTVMAVYKDQFYFGINEDVYRLDNGQPMLFHDAASIEWRLQYLTAEGPNYLLAGYRCQDANCFNRALYVLNEQGLVREVTTNCTGLTTYAIEDERGRIWYGDDWDFVRVLDDIQGDCRQLDFGGPYSDRTWQVATAPNGDVWVASGALDVTLSPVFIDHGFYRLSNGQWTTYNRWNREELRGPDRIPGGDDQDIQIVVDVVVNEVTNKVYAASFLEGLAELDLTNDAIQVFDENNSALQIATGAGANRVRVVGMAVDPEGTLWMTNHLADEQRPIVAYTADQQWYSFGQSCGRNGLFDIAVDVSGFKWAVTDIGSGGGVVVFDEGELEDPNDDRCRLLTSVNSALPTNEVRSVVADLDGDVWVGTSDGVVIFECGASAFEDACTGTRRIVTRDEFNAYLLETEDVFSLAVDGANRKWAGTSNGVFLLSADGTEQIHHFTTDNSPLLDNNVRGIAVNNATGEVFFATDLGLVSFQSDATAGGRVNRAEIEVYPNPVRPDYEGPIAIRGLARDANVKITDLNGKLVFETQAQGGQAIWNGRDYNGRKAQTGVYLVFSTTNPRNAGFDNPDAAVGKIVLIN